jgi:mannose-6-phosphate isomerase-like protein (cupin superfamily)
MTTIFLEISTNDTSLFNSIKHNKYTQTVQPISYKDLIIKKPWGFEFLFFSESNISGWILYIQKMSSTSFHCHITKDTPMIVLKGKVIIKTADNIYHLEKADYIHIPKGKFHSIEAEVDSIVCEFEIQPNKTDLMRINDRYGRNQQGYEGIYDMLSVKEINEYFYLDNNSYRNDNFYMSMNNENNLNKKKILRTFNVLVEGKIQDNDKYISEGSLLDSFSQNHNIKVLKIQILE